MDTTFSQGEQRKKSLLESVVMEDLQQLTWLHTMLLFTWKPVKVELSLCCVILVLPLCEKQNLENVSFCNKQT